MAPTKTDVESQLMCPRCRSIYAITIDGYCVCPNGHGRLKPLAIELRRRVATPEAADVFYGKWFAHINRRLPQARKIPYRHFEWTIDGAGKAAFRRIELFPCDSVPNGAVLAFWPCAAKDEKFSVKRLFAYIPLNGVTPNESED